MRLSEIKGENAIDVLADMLDPLTEMLADPKVKEVARSKSPTLIKASKILKYQKKAVLEMLAVLNQTPVEEFKPSLLELPIMLAELINDIKENKELISLFQSQGQMITDAPFGPATENIKGTEEI
jgi:CRISPR/Cas system-associated endonuclease Cas3-HD